MAASPSRLTPYPSSLAWRLVLEKLPLFALSITCSLITVYAQSEAKAVRSSEEYPLLTRLGNAAIAYMEYVGMTFWPVNLSVFYPYDKYPSVFWQVGAAILLVCLTLLVLFQRSRRYLFVGWFWYLGTLVPVIGIIQVGRQAMADRYTYIPSIGLFVALVWGLADVFARLRLPRWAQGGVAGAAVLACALLTRIQVEHWRDAWTLWENAVRANPENFLAHQRLAALYVDQGKDEEAIQSYRLAIQSNPNDPKSYAHLATIYTKRSQLAARNGDKATEAALLDEMIKVLRDALGIKADEPYWHFNLGQGLLATGKPDEGIEELRTAIRLKPDVADWHLALGQGLLATGKPDEGIEELRAAIRLKPDLGLGHWLLYNALKETQPREAAQHKEQAYKLVPELRGKVAE